MNSRFYGHMLLLELVVSMQCGAVLAGVHDAAPTAEASSSIEFFGKITDVLPEGIVCSPEQNPAETKSLVFISCNPAGRSIGDEFSGKVFNAGEYDYLFGTLHKLPAYAQSEYKAFSMRHRRAAGDDSIDPPYNLVWGMSKKMLLDIFTEKHMTVTTTSEMLENGHEVLHVVGLGLSDLALTTNFEFGKNGLTRVVEHLQDNTWDDRRYVEEFKRGESRLQKRLGNGDNISATGKIGSTWTRGKTSVTVTLSDRDSDHNRIIEAVYAIHDR